ncbi:uncharacterized protein LOC141530389 isoform X2 [Cotesia typhae]|uniref:uncharacterized protein LOC141530389 isoform X2 n=1 Tax=Cotesia typhae TaxID=2053667 RepID=UPI003D680109
MTPIHDTLYTRKTGPGIWNILNEKHDSLIKYAEYLRGWFVEMTFNFYVINIISINSMLEDFNWRPVD